VLVGEAEIAVAALRLGYDQLRGCEFRKVAACRLRRDVRRVGELARGQRAAVDQRGEDVGAGRIADQCRDRRR
jgi:hypothetical protein